MKHRGRIQAQGENLEASEAWSKNKAPTKKDRVDIEIQKGQALMSPV